MGLARLALIFGGSVVPPAPSQTSEHERVDFLGLRPRVRNFLTLSTVQQTHNQVSLQGRTGPPTVRLTRDGPVFASVPVTISDVPRMEITVTGLGLEAAGIVCLRRGDLLRVEGVLALDPSTGDAYVQATAVAKLVATGTSLVPIGPSVDELDRLAALLPSP